MAVVEILNDASLDLLELSRGSLERPKVVGVAVMDGGGGDGARAGTARREAYFLEFAGATWARGITRSRPEAQQMHFPSACVEPEDAPCSRSAGAAFRRMSIAWVWPSDHGESC